MKQKVKNKSYKSAAGGWGALKSSVKTIVKEKGIINTTKALFQMNQPDGFDCPGCAWPDPENHSKFAEYCENGVKAIAAESTGKIVEPIFFKNNSIEKLLTYSDYELESFGRLTHPMIITKDQKHYIPVTWENAFELIGNQLNSHKSPDEALFYTSGRTSNEAAFLYQLFGRVYGTNNFPDCSNLCHESSGVALKETIGIGKGTVSLHDFDFADLIITIGQNPGTNHPRMLSELQNASRRGATVISINPLKERGLVEFTHPKEVLPMLTLDKTPISKHYYQIKIGGDLAALKAISKILLEKDDKEKETILDHAFIDKHTTGFEEFKIDAENENLETLSKICGLTLEELNQIANLYQNSKNTIICWAMGITQTKYAVATIQYIVNLLLLKGNIGRQGAGVCPVRGHSNVQGDRTMGITEKPSEKFLQKLSENFNFNAPRKHGHDAVESIHAMLKGKCKFFMGMGGNFAKACPNTSETEKALKNCDMTVHVSTKLNRSHLTHGKTGIILPCLGRSEIDLQNNKAQFITVEDSMSMVHASVGKNKPASNNLKSEVAIVTGIAKATIKNSKIDWDAFQTDYNLIRDKIEKSIDGFKDFNYKVQKPGGFHLRNSAANREWDNKTGKATFTTHKVYDLNLPKGQLIMMTIRSHDQYNTTIYGLDDRYRGIYNGRNVIFINPKDIAEANLKEGELVNIHSCYPNEPERTVKGFQIIPYEIPVGCAATYFPETNELVSIQDTALRSNTPLSKYVPIKLTKH